MMLPYPSKRHLRAFNVFTIETFQIIKRIEDLVKMWRCWSIITLPILLQTGNDITDTHLEFR